VAKSEPPTSLSFRPELAGPHRSLSFRPADNPTPLSSRPSDNPTPLSSRPSDNPTPLSSRPSEASGGISPDIAAPQALQAALNCLQIPPLARSAHSVGMTEGAEQVGMTEGAEQVGMTKEGASQPQRLQGTSISRHPGGYGQ